MIPTLFCIVLVFFVSFYLLNLMLAVLMESYIEYEKMERTEKKIKFKAKRDSLQKRIEEL